MSTHTSSHTADHQSNRQAALRDEVRDLTGSLVVTSVGLGLLRWFDNPNGIGAALLLVGLIATLLSLMGVRAAAKRGAPRQ